MRGSFVPKIPVRKAGLALCLLEPAPLKFCDTLIAVNAAAGTRKWFQGGLRWKLFLHDKINLLSFSSTVVSNLLNGRSTLFLDTFFPFSCARGV